MRHFEKIPEQINELETIYQTENKLMQLISQGAIQQIEQLLPSVNWDLFQKRNPNPLRSSKNYLIILNTLLRKAAENGGIHPMRLHEISSFYANKIELLTSEKNTARLAQEMIRKYTLLVRNHSLEGYSLLIRKVITHITNDLTGDLSLRAQADLFDINASYLSYLFKQETGQTLSSYVNQKRIEHAVFLLNTTELQVQVIAHECGFTDTCYFTKLFKKIVGQTPSQYRHFIQGK